LTADPVRDQADAVLRVLDAALPTGRLVAAYLYGSAVAGGLKPDSDLDILGVVDRRLADGERRAVIDGVLPISGRRTRPPAWRPVELTLVVASEVRPWRYPPRFDLQYGEWLREEFLAGQLDTAPGPNPDVAILLTMVRATGQPLVGPPADLLIDPVPRDDVARAMLDELPSLLGDLEDDTRNVLLTLARMWSTLATGEIRSKDAAVDWALPLLPDAHRELLALARDAYLGTAVDAWKERMPAATALADTIVERIRALPPPTASG
jgi:predicted nucleotidyltransferase